jgi:chromate transporter
MSGITLGEGTDPGTTQDRASAEARLPGFGEALRVWLRIGLLSFGGPAGQIAMLHREVVDERHWISDARFLHALSFCNLLPGPEAQQLATYLGWLLHGVRGGIAAGTLFVLPGVALMLALSVLYATLGEVPAVAALFFGLKCAVLVLVVEALLRVSRRALKTREAWALAVGAFLVLYAFGTPFPIVVLAAALLGYFAPGAFRGGGHGQAVDGCRAGGRARPPRPAGRQGLARGPGGRRALAAARRGADAAGARRLRRHRPVLLENGGGDLRGRLCRARLCRAGGGRELWLAHRASDAGRPRPC